MEKSIVAEAVLSNHDVVMEFIEQTLEELDCPMKQSMIISVASDEWIANICEYAYENEPGEFKVVISPTEDPKGVRLVFFDQGTPFDPMTREDPDVNLGIDERQIGGLGIFMIKKTMDKVDYEYRDGSNILAMEKYF